MLPADKIQILLINNLLHSSIETSVCFWEIICFPLSFCFFVFVIKISDKKSQGFDRLRGHFQVRLTEIRTEEVATS